MIRPTPSWGAPLNFMVMIVAGYGALRTYQLWPATVEAVEAQANFAAKRPMATTAPQDVTAANGVTSDSGPQARIALRERRAALPFTIWAHRWLDGPRPAHLAWGPNQKGKANRYESPIAPPLIAIEVQVAPIRRQEVSSPAGVLAPPPPDRLRPTGQLSGYGWLAVRGGGTSSSQLPSLGGSQAGFRLDWRLRRSVLLTGRVVSTIGKPLAGRHQREATIGLAYLPRKDRSVELALERRVSLDGGRNAWQIRVAGGGDWDIVGLKAEAYGQAGIADLRQKESFVEGQVALRKPVTTSGGVRFSLGGGVWGAAQTGAKRLDIGPQAVAEFTLGVPVRLSGEYRVRVEGNALPASGPAFTLSTSF